MRRKLNHGWWLLALLALATAGCSGINSTQSVSPLNFLIPGLHVQNESPGRLLLNGAPVLVCWGGDRAPHAIP